VFYEHYGVFPELIAFMRGREQLATFAGHAIAPRTKNASHTKYRSAADGTNATNMAGDNPNIILCSNSGYTIGELEISQLIQEEETQ